MYSCKIQTCVFAFSALQNRKQILFGHSELGTGIQSKNYFCLLTSSCCFNDLLDQICLTDRFRCECTNSIFIGFFDVWDFFVDTGINNSGCIYPKLFTDCKFSRAAQIWSLSDSPEERIPLMMAVAIFPPPMKLIIFLFMFFNSFQ